MRKSRLVVVVVISTKPMKSLQKYLWASSDVHNIVFNCELWMPMKPMHYDYYSNQMQFLCKRFSLSFPLQSYCLISFYGRVLAKLINLWDVAGICHTIWGLFRSRFQKGLLMCQT
jgi:hypothetical protein